MGVCLFGFDVVFGLFFCVCVFFVFCGVGGVGGIFGANLLQK